MRLCPRSPRAIETLASGPPAPEKADLSYDGIWISRDSRSAVNSSRASCMSCVPGVARVSYKLSGAIGLYKIDKKRKRQDKTYPVRHGAAQAGCQAEPRPRLPGPRA